MGLLSNLFNSIIFGLETEALINKLSKWEQEHFQSTGYRYDRQTGQSVITFRYTTYKNDAGGSVNLSNIPLPFTGKQEIRGIVNHFKDSAKAVLTCIDSPVP